MNTFFFYTPHYLLIMFLIMSAATGIIFIKNKTKGDAFIFFAFVIYSFTITMNLFVGYSALIDAETNVTTHVRGVLSINQTQSLQLIANFLLSLGFVLKAYAIVKKT